MYLDAHITNKCNLNCHHCYLGGSGGTNMDFEIFKDIVYCIFLYNYVQIENAKELGEGQRF